MSSLANLMPNEKRKAQNRVAQRKHRDKKKALERRMKETEEKLTSEIASLQVRLEHGEATRDLYHQIGRTMVELAPPEHVMESIEMPDTTACPQSSTTDPSDFGLPGLNESCKALWNEDCGEDFASLASANFSIDPQTDVAVDTNQFSFTPRISTPSVSGVSVSDVNQHGQMYLTTLQNTSDISNEHPTQDLGDQSGVVSKLHFDESFLMSSVHPDPYTTNFQIAQLLEVAKHKEHAAQLLQEAAHCREYTVRSLLTIPGAWSVSTNEYPSDICSSLPDYAYNSGFVTWDSDATSYHNSTSNTPLSIPAM